MPVRQHYNEQPNRVKMHMKEMGAYVIKALGPSVQAFSVRDQELPARSTVSRSATTRSARS